MPELPEVETTVNDLSKAVIGKRIIDLWTDTPKRLSVLTKDRVVLNNKKINGVYRKGKNIILNLSGGIKVLIHQKIAGHILFGEWLFKKGKWIPESEPLIEKINSYIHFVITLNNGKMIAISDPRKFAKMEIWDGEELNRKLSVDIGPDPMEVESVEFGERITKKGSIIKTVLMNQSVISGVGNIYSDEILWDARISPYRRPKNIDSQEMAKLFKSTQKILVKAIELKGDSMSDYRLIDGTKGGYQSEHKVYGREGLLCLRKDGGTIERRKLGSRSLRFCPVCQK